jgi:uncharacterized peroxidase-related enzyme
MTIMARLTAVDPATAGPQVKPLLDAVQKALGVTPNMMRTMAQSPAVLEAYLGMTGALAKGKLSRRTGEQLALVTAQANGCDYCAAAHTLLGQGAGLSEADVEQARQGTATDDRTSAALEFARAVIASRGHVADQELQAVRAAGLTEGEVGEVVAHVALNVFTNYFNSVARTDLDFPAVRPTTVPSQAAA